MSTCARSALNVSFCTMIAASPGKELAYPHLCLGKLNPRYHPRVTPTTSARRWQGVKDFPSCLGSQEPVRLRTGSKPGIGIRAVFKARGIDLTAVATARPLTLEWSEQAWPELET
jgi:hypothetical protein